ncbi:MAG: pseudouridine synthase [Planctomycetes bacterium]|jgi:pseudouridine synthase|nr:pseudouridine synthase [Planctomycetota bacterium]
MPPSHPNIPAEFADAARGIRLQKAMAEAGVASRRECEAMITEGRVTVNGKTVAALPAWVDPAEDRVEVDGRPIQKKTRKSLTGGAHKPVYLLVNKPRNVISTSDDPEGRPTVLDLVDMPMKQRLFAVGRLDADSTGLLLLTNDGELANRLTHPRYEVTKRYRVVVRGRIEEGDLARLRKGLLLAHDRGGKVKRAAMESVRIVKRQTDRTQGDKTLLEITLAEGQNREIRRLLARVGLKVRRLERTAIGPLKLKGLARGQWRRLDAKELGMLRKAAGLGK